MSSYLLSHTNTFFLTHLKSIHKSLLSRIFHRNIWSSNKRQMFRFIYPRKFLVYVSSTRL